MDFDPRDLDSRDEERTAPNRRRSGGSHRDDHDDPRSPGDLSRDPADSDGHRTDRGPRDSHESRADRRDRDARDHAHPIEREFDERARDTDTREVFTRHLDLPRGPERELIHDRNREYSLRGSESRTLAAVGAFRVVSNVDLRDHDGRPADPRSGDLRHLREQGLVETTRVPGHHDHAVALTKAGRSLLEGHRDPDHEPHQTFHAGLVRERELEHDLQIYRAYEEAEARLLEGGARIERVVLDHELKGDYQRWLHDRDGDRDDYDGHHDRTPDEVREWACEHQLPYFDGEVHFPDVRIEYQEPDGRWTREDIEVVTPHYRGAHRASLARSGFSCYRASSLSFSTRGGGGRRGGRHGGLAEELWR